MEMRRLVEKEARVFLGFFAPLDCNPKNPAKNVNEIS